MADTTQSSYPNLNAGGSGTNGSLSGLKDSLVNNAQSAADAISNHPTYQNLQSGPVAQKAREEANKTSNQFSNVANSRVIPEERAATGQPLTHYHSMFYNILSWENPRVTGIAYASVVSLIFFTRYVPVLKYFFKASYTILGVIAAAEIAGKLVFERGLASQMRPRKYYTIPRESLEAATEDVEQLVNFFVIEFQRIVFAENVYATVSAFASALVAYFLVKFVPKWGIALIATSVVFFLPLIYIQNRELIDGQLNNASTIINQQATQVRDLAAQHTSRASEITKSTVSQYSAKAQELMGQAQAKASSVAGSQSPSQSTTDTFKSQPTTTDTLKSQPATGDFKNNDFPSAPTSDPAAPAPSIPSTHASEVAHSETDPQPIPAL
ncbi:hypothetical protein K461DRAFT_45331 [Myriangium duriaei CBS 260.36]|uniref:Reticulon-like protein n=1 Tax=Myriangium duriaei CBS 260.36 TaxID=1168546 RepID=A0A9P4MD10_9PEZI|nr:hypothetical protein K461DRAFT_45331 [Myriangium duriaei CBS 260.36]